MKKQTGFTLIELMIVIAVIGILAAIALPAYQDFTIRSRVVEALNFSSILRQTVSENYFSRGGYLNATLDCQGITNTTFNSNNISNISCDNSNSSIEIQTTLKAGNVIIKMIPTALQDKIVWSCKVDQLSSFKYVPPECRNL